MNRNEAWFPLFRSAIAATVLLAVGLPVTARAVEPHPLLSSVTALDDPDLASRARRVIMGGELRLERVQLGDGGDLVAVELERFEVVEPDARVIVHGHDGDYEIPMPANAYFKGAVAGDPSSLAVLVVQEDGDVHGFLARAGEAYVLGQQWAPRYDSVESIVDLVDAERDFGDRVASWQCDNEHLTTPADPLDLLLGTGEPIEPPQATTTKYEVEIVFDTDFEFWDLFDDDTAATNYITTLAAGASAIYDRDINTQWKVKGVHLYNAGAGADPWGITGGTLCSLFEVGNYWQANRSGEARDLVHFLSGKDLGGGVAWRGVLCAPDFACDPAVQNCGEFPTCSTALPNPSYGGGYAFSADIDGDYGGALVWDIVVTTHEGGHNFASPHTHCYNKPDTPGTVVVDECFNLEGGCWAGDASVPAGGGSIMSYCHLLGAGLSNINLYLGRAGFYGANSERVQTVTRAEVEANIACLDEVGSCGFPDNVKTVNGTENGTVIHGACEKLIFENYTVGGTGDVTGQAPVHEIHNNTTVIGELALINTP